MKRPVRLSLACLGMLFAVGMANAVVIVPGGAALLPGSTTTGGVVLATAIDPVVGMNALSEIRFTGVLTSFVLQEAGGTLDFWYQYANDANSIDGVERMTMTHFGGFTTDVDWMTDQTGTINPIFGDRSLDGAKVGVSFVEEPLGDGQIDPGETSRWIVIKTNATQYDIGTTSLINGAIDTVVTFSPVPEPASLAVLGIGLAGLIRRRRSRN